MESLGGRGRWLHGELEMYKDGGTQKKDKRTQSDSDGDTERKKETEMEGSRQKEKRLREAGRNNGREILRHEDWRERDREAQERVCKGKRDSGQERPRERPH